MPLYQLGDDAPQIDPQAWVADSAQLIGKVALAAQASVWYGCVLRGDTDWLRIGARSNIQDGSVLHTDPGLELRVGEGVTVGHRVVLHGCEIGDRCLIGMGAVVLNRARIGANSIVGAGALVTEGKVFPEGVLIVGSPARVARELTPEQIAGLSRGADNYLMQQQRHRTGLRRIERQED